MFTADGREVPRHPAGPGLVDLQLRIGDGLQIAFLADQPPAEHEVKLLGWLPGRSLMVTAPEKGRMAALAEGAAVAVRLFSEGQARGYSGTVLAVAAAPFPHLHLSYPAHLEALEGRKTERVRSALAATIIAGDKEIAAVVRDLSATGALLFTHAALGGKGERFVVRMRVPLEHLGDQPVELPAVIRTAAEGVELKGSLWRSRCGIEFEAPSAQATLVLRAYLYERFVGG